MKRKFLTSIEVKALIDALTQRKKEKYEYKHNDRDVAMILLASNHGLRASELIQLRWNQIFKDNNGVTRIQIQRLKNGKGATHRISDVELMCLNKIKRTSEYIFVSEANTPLVRASFNAIIKRAAKKAKLDIPVHPHMLRHAAGYRLINNGKDIREIQDFLGHRNIQNTVIYTEWQEDRFHDFT